MLSQTSRGNSQYAISVPDNGTENLIARKCTGVVVYKSIILRDQNGLKNLPFLNLLNEIMIWVSIVAD